MLYSILSSSRYKVKSIAHSSYLIRLNDSFLVLQSLNQADDDSTSTVLRDTQAWTSKLLLRLIVKKVENY